MMRSFFYFYPNQSQYQPMPLHFKKHIQQKSDYKGGKSMDEVSQNGRKIHKLSSNENPLGSSPLAIDAIKKYTDSVHLYPERTGIRLREALVEFYEGQLSLEQFVTTNSGVANIELITRAFVDEDSECIYSNPAFGPYKGFPKRVGGIPIDIPLIGDNFVMNVSAILDAVNDKTRLIFITSPNNPTGTHLPKGQVDELIYNLPDHVVTVFDEVYYQYADAEDYVRALPYVLEGKNVIAVNSFSKAYGLAGMRIGYSYSTPEIASYLRKLRRPFMLNTLSQEAAIAALKDEDFIRSTVDHVHREKKYLYEELDRLGVKYWKTQANFILVYPHIPPVEFEEAMIAEGIMVRPVAGFGAEKGVRVTIGTHEANQAYIQALENILK